MGTVMDGETAFAERGLSTYTPYTYAVLSFDTAGNESVLSAELTITTARAPLEAPKGSVREVTSRSITVGWTPKTDATGYTLAGSLSNEKRGPFSKQQEPTGSESTLTGLMPNTPYYLFLNACNEDQCSEYDLVGETVTHAEAPGLKSVDVKGREAYLTIDPKGNPAGTVYQIEISEGGGDYTPASRGDSLTPVVGGLNPGERYQFRVMAESLSGVKTALSNEVATTITAETVESARAYPVPFRPGEGVTRMTFDQLPEGTSIQIYSMRGGSVKTLISDATGKTEWDLKNDDGTLVSSGVYLVILKKDGGRKQMKVMVQK